MGEGRRKLKANWVFITPRVVGDLGVPCENNPIHHSIQSQARKIDSNVLIQSLHITVHLPKLSESTKLFVLFSGISGYFSALLSHGYWFHGNTVPIETTCHLKIPIKYLRTPTLLSSSSWQASKAFSLTSHSITYSFPQHLHPRNAKAPQTVNQLTSLHTQIRNLALSRAKSANHTLCYTRTGTPPHSPSPSLILPPRPFFQSLSESWRFHKNQDPSTTTAFISSGQIVIETYLRSTRFALR